jgi:rfaE bifunctional protein nucleotidyltransferase chain/domain
MHIPKLSNLAQTVEDVQRLRADRRKIVFTNGCFDILHAGHVLYLTEAKTLGDHLVVALNSDQSVRLFKGPTRPICNETHRAMVLAALEVVDRIIPFDEPSPVHLIEAIQPEIYVKGGDLKIEDIPEAPAVKRYGGTVKVLSLMPGLSTTSMIERILATGR